MESQTMFLDCPAYLDEDGSERCGLPAEVIDRFTMRSTGGPIDGVKICCPSSHQFNGPIESLPGTRIAASSRPPRRSTVPPLDTRARRPAGSASPIRRSS
jgi:hypothetical protein